jgi:hypothetical protein
MLANPVLSMFADTVRSRGKSAPLDYETWLRELFPKYLKYPFAERHHAFWRWLWDIDTDSAPRPFVGIWPRGGAKSTSAELGTAALGLRGKRKYALYVRETQEQADNSVSNIATLFEAQSVSEYYPLHAERAVGKFGNSKGWRRNRLRTAGGFTVDAIGLDTAARGVKVEEQRPDLIIFDDIDGKHDTTQTTARKISTITSTLLPTGSENFAVIAIQNLIIPDGVFSMLADGRADFLALRIVSGPFPAIEKLETTWDEDTESGARRAIIVAGTPTWEGQHEDACQKLMDEIGLAAFLTECQHDVSARKEGLALKFVPENHYTDLSDDEVRTLVKQGSVFGGMDFGRWRFAFNLWAVDREGIPYCVHEYFSQLEQLSDRAKAIHNICNHYGVKALRIWGDAANPTDIAEINAAFARGWTESTGDITVSRLRVTPVAMENKMRAASVERINDVLGRNAIRFRRTLGTGQKWRLNFTAASQGVEMTGSRLMWEIGKWSYPIPKEGVVQKQDPDDSTADGADEIAGMRYALMSWWKAAKPEEEPEISAFDPAVLKDEHERKYKLSRRRERRTRDHLIDDNFGSY